MLNLKRPNALPMVALLLFFIVGCKKDVPSTKENKESNTISTSAEKYLKLAVKDANECKIDSAKLNLDSARTLFQLYPLEMSNLELDLKRIEDTSFIRGSVLSLDYNGLVALSESRLQIRFLLSSQCMDSLFKVKMARLLTVNKKWFKLKKKEDEAKVLEAKAIDAGKRLDYASGLRYEFLDGGFDIEVKAYGKDNRKLRLTYSLFNAVFAHKFQKEGMLEKWVRAGFYEVELSNGYDYRAKWDLSKYARM